MSAWYKWYVNYKISNFAVLTRWGTVCGIEDAYDPVSDTWNHFDSVIPIAGSYGTSTGKGLDATFTRLKKEDTENEGLRMELHGGKYAELDQMAIIEFQCDLEKTGNEGFDSIDDRRRSTNTTESPEDGESGDGDDKDEAKSLQFVSYGLRDDKTKLLRLNWKTKYACEDYEDDDNDGNSSGGSSHWGFFTWFIIMSVQSNISGIISLTSPQFVSWNSFVFDLRVMAELQPLRRSRMGFVTSRRHHQRYAIFIQGLGQEGGRHSTRGWLEGRVQCSVIVTA